MTGTSPCLITYTLYNKVGFMAIRQTPVETQGTVSYYIQDIRSGHTERGLPQRTAVSVRCGQGAATQKAVCRSGLRFLSAAGRVRPHRTRSAAADCGLCPLRTGCGHTERGLPQRAAVQCEESQRSGDAR